MKALLMIGGKITTKVHVISFGNYTFSGVTMTAMIVWLLKNWLGKSARRLPTNSAALITRRHSVSVIVAMATVAIMWDTALNT